MKILGSNFENCRIFLKEDNGFLFEGDNNLFPVVICFGEGIEGCEPKLKENHWYCSEGPGECVKSSMMSAYV